MFEGPFTKTGQQRLHRVGPVIICPKSGYSLAGFVMEAYDAVSTIRIESATHIASDGV